ncbi:hypothetical protein P7C70_g4001, partial [Phenoliferia sp. Uapishka_3]
MPAPIRNLSRVRVPSARALAVAQDQAEATLPKGKKSVTKTAPSRKLTRNRKVSPPPPPVKESPTKPKGKGKSRTTRSGASIRPEEEEVADEDEGMPSGDSEQKEPDLTLLADEDVERWLKLDFGPRMTGGTNDEAPQEVVSVPASRASSSPADPEDNDSDAHMSAASSPSAAGSDDDVDDEDENDLAINSDEEVANHLKRGKKTSGGRGDGTKRRAMADSDAEDYNGDEEVVLRDRTRARKGKGPAISVARAPVVRVSRRVSTVAKSPSSKAQPAVKDGFYASPPVAPTAPTEPVAGTATGPSATSRIDKTRTHVVAQLKTLFSSIFATSEADSDSIGVQSRAAAFAETVEGELFDGFSELDAKGVRGPRTKFLAKFRSLSFNLKTNPDFRSRISANQLTPTQIVNMTNEDLLTPELRAMADNIRAASLKHSVKEVAAIPTVKRTHKGEEQIDNFAGAVAEEERRATEQKDLVERERQVVEKRERSASMSHHSPSGFSPSPSNSPLPDATFAAASPVVNSPLAMNSPPSSVTLPVSTPAANPRSRSSLTSSRLSISADDLGMDLNSDPAIDDATQGGEMHPPPPPSRSRSSFDMATVWGQIKESPTMASSEFMTSSRPDEGDAEDAELYGMGGNREDDDVDGDFDPFAVVDGLGGGQEDEDFEASLFRDEEAPPRTFVSKSEEPLTATTGAPAEKSTTPDVEPPSVVAPEKNPLADLEKIWTGNVIVPDEGGFPSNAVQVGGRSFGTSDTVWKQMLPRGLTMDGRIPTAIASKYLVECSFATKRELVVVALLPDLSGPTAEFPNKPSSQSCLAKQAHVIDFYVKKDRIGVIAPSDSLKKVVKDIYIIPLRKDQPLPEYLELLDDHSIPETGLRQHDLLICV